MTAFDVICIGCGPAGNLAAYLLARRGLSVLLLEREALPRGKVCGGGLTARALDELPYDIAPIIHRRINCAHVAFGRHGEVQLAGEDLGAMVERSELDAFMTERAVDAGATLLASTALVSITQDSPNRVRIDTTRGCFSARLLIGADGAASTVRGELYPTWRPDFAFGVEANYFPPEGIELPERLHRQVVFEFGSIRDGYGWIFPKRDHVNVGVYRLVKRRSAPSLRRALEKFAAASPALAGWVSTPSSGHPIPLSTGRQPLGRGRTILIGDAAGLTEAFFGEGIAFAMKSAALAANWATGWLVHERGEAARSFGVAIRPMVTELRWSQAVALARYRVPPRWMLQALGTQVIRDATVALVKGEMGYRRSFWRMPLLLVPSLWQRGMTSARAARLVGGA